MQQQSEPLMFKIAISLSFIDKLNKSWHLLHTYGQNLNALFKIYQLWQTSYSFDVLDLLTSILQKHQCYQDIAFSYYS